MESSKDFYVVGIGASAGGLEAIEAFFSKVPSKTGLAFVIIQHLSPDYKSLMPEILLKRTSLPVHTAEDGMMVKPDNVYLIPRKMNMKIFHSRLHLTEKSSSQMLNLPIDIFFHSLAEDFEDKAIAVVLSGTGSDGSRGIRMVKENGGIVIVQDIESSKFDGMPKSAITTGMVDYIIEPQEMPEKILRYVQHPYTLEKDKTIDQNLVSEDYLAKIILILKESFGLDFTYYKEATISRRIERRLSINQIDSLKDYMEYLTVSKNEQTTLYKELLIGVTKFFRDPEAFQFIAEKVIPKILENKKPDEEIRIWVSACSTGEEAYSIAILFKEYMLEHNLTNDIKIFATDIDKTAIEFASMGLYNSSMVADVSASRINKFFIQHGENFKVKEIIREMIVFATQNVIKDPPFNKIDFLTCRNLLIYFQSPLQQKVLAMFNFALNRNGYMFLGSSETIGEMEAYFENVSIKYKIFKSVLNARITGNNLSRFPGNIAQIVPIKKPSFSLKNSASDLMSVFTEKILSDNAPVTIVVNENYEIINSFGNLSKFLALPNINRLSEGFHFEITKMVPSNLKLTFSIAINKAIKSDEDVVHQNMKYQRSDKEFLLVDLVFSPLKRSELNAKFVVVYFCEKKEVSIAPTEIHSFEDVDQLAQQRILDLENELKHSRENLQASIEELETTNEELQSTNEELISANEELQSTNEELQSVNEELYTVNTEFQAKNNDLVVMNNDMENLLQNSDVRIIFLDMELKIRKYTDNITDLFNLKSNDQGRPISDITHRIKDDELLEKIKQVLNNSSVIQKTIESNQKWFKMKILPYITQKGYIDGVVLSFVDVTDYQKVQENLKEAQRIAQLGNWILDHRANVLHWSEEIYNIFEMVPDEFSASYEGFLAHVHPDDREAVNKAFTDSLKTKSAYEIKHRVLTKNKKIKHVKEKCHTEFDANGLPLKSFGVVIDISDQIMAQQALIESQNTFKMVIDVGLTAFYLLEAKRNEKGEILDFILVEVNKQAEDQMQMKRTELIGYGICELFPVNRSNGFFEKYKKVAETRQSYEEEYFIPDEYAAPGWYQHQVIPTKMGIAIFNKDISEQKKLQLQLEETTILYKSLFQNMTKGFALHEIILDAHGKPINYMFIDVNESFEKITGLKRTEIIGKTIREVLPDVEDLWIERYGKVAMEIGHLVFEEYSKDLKKMFRINAYAPKKGQFATLFEEI